MSEISNFNIDLESIKENFKFSPDGKGLTHKQGNKYKLLPYVANEKTLVSEFSGVVGAFSRLISNKELKGKFEVESFIEDVADQIGEYEGNMSREAFKNIVRTMFIDNDNLVDFDIKTINYISATSADQKIAGFLYSVLFEDEIKKYVSVHYDRDVENILYKLVLKSLPELKTKETHIGEYKCYLPFVREQFIKDFKFIISNEELYRDSLKRFLEYYYVFYISQLIMKLDAFEKADLNTPDKLYYTLDWERTSKTRTAYQFGWEKIKNNVASLFSHAVTLELLNHNEIEDQLSYIDIANLFSEIDSEKAAQEVRKVTEAYKSQLQDVNWNNMINKDRVSEISGYNSVYELYDAIRYQFEHSSTRFRANEAYKNWFVKFVNKNFAKRRGQLGYNLNITEDDIILMTKICINENEKLKLNKLFEEFESRGLFFDRDSKMKIVQLYEKLNLLEKKSDSGDAQYVKSVL